MKPSEIITKDLEERGEDPQQVLQAIQKMVAAKTAVLLSTENSVLLVKAIQDVAEAHLFTVASPLTLAKDLKYFDNKLQELGVPAVYGQASNPQIIELMKKAGINVEDSDLEQYNWKVSYGRSK
jgi:hypothetical protein